MMRKHLSILCFGMIAAALPLRAQTGLGVVGGYVSSTRTEAPEVAGRTWAGRSGFAGGLSLGAELARGVSIGLEGLYIQKGSDVHVGTGVTSEKSAYLEVPLLLRIAIGDVKRPHLFLAGGGQYSSLLTCKDVVAGVADLDCKGGSGLKSSDYGVVFGGGVASGRLSLSVRYDLGLANTNNDPGATGTTPPVFKNRAVTAMVGIGLGK